MIHMKERVYSLLENIQRLFNKMAMNVVYSRIRSYRTYVKSNQDVDITSTIDRHITSLTDKSVKQNQSRKGDIQIPPHAGLNHDSHYKNPSNYDGHEKFVYGETELAKHLKEMKSSTTIYQGLGDKLKESALEHISSAIRFARDGNIHHAKLHSSIASQSLEESRHYITDEKYLELVTEIEQHLKSVN